MTKQTATPSPNSQKALSDELQATWARFQQLAARAEREAKQTSDGRPSGETDYALARLSDRLDVLEAKLSSPIAPGALYQPTGEVKSFQMGGTRETYSYQTGTPAHIRFMRYVRFGARAADVDRLRFVDFTERTQDALKAMTVSNDTTGGYLVSEEFASEIQRRMVDASPVRRLARVSPFAQDAGQDLLVPLRSEPHAAHHVSETGSRAATGDFDASFSLERVPTSELLFSTKVSRQLLADSRYPLDSELAQAAAESFSLTEGLEFVKGTGAGGEMAGLNALSLPAGQVHTATGTSSTVAAADVLDLIDHLPEQYLPNAQFILKASTLLAIRKLRGDSTNGNFLFVPASSGFGSTLAGYPYTLVNDLDGLGAGAGKMVAYFGDFSQAYRLAIRQQLTVIRLAELYAEAGMVGFIIIERVGGSPVNKDAVCRLVTGA